MQVKRFRPIAAATMLLLVAPVFAVTAGEVHSQMKNVRAVVESQGFSIQPAFDMDATPQAGDLAPPQYFEIIRPFDKPVSINRLFTSCSCIQLEAAKRTFAPGERAILKLRNIRPTPAAGQVYAIFVQMSGPIRTTLRFDTFVKTGLEAPEAHNPNAANHAGEAEDVTNDPPEDLDDDAEDENEGGLRPPSGASASDELDAMLKQQHEKVARKVGEGVDAARDAMDDYFQQDGSEPDRSGGNDDLPDFDAETPEIPLTDATPAAPTTIAVPPPSDVYEAPAGEDIPDLPLVTPTALAPRPSAPSPVAPPPAAAPAPAAPAPAGVPLPRPARDPNAPKPVQLVSLITIGVRDMPASIRFYEALGWRRAARGKYDQTAFFQLQGQVLALYPLADQLREQNMVGATPSPGGITLALHVADKADVWTVYQRFVDAGGSSLQPPMENTAGAVTSYVADPDGNPWEISWVPQFRMDEDGGLWLP